VLPRKVLPGGGRGSLGRPFRALFFGGWVFSQGVALGLIRSPLQGWESWVPVPAFAGMTVDAGMMVDEGMWEGMEGGAHPTAAVTSTPPIIRP